jgi:hypothetical protein
MSGDKEERAAHWAHEAGIDHYSSQALPQDKEDLVRRLQSEGHHVAMIGDGINDTQALAAADVSIAMGKGTDVAMDVAQVTLMGTDLRALPEAISLSHRTVSMIHQNLFWAFIYNMVCIPLAAGLPYAFGIPFQSIQYNNANSYVQCRMPLHIHKPQFKTEDEVYKTLDGDNMVLYSAFAEEYELETEYIPYEMHKIIIAALSCDHVTINGISVYKSSSYDIDWDNYILNDCGGKLVKATCKVLVNQRNVNSNVIIRKR